MKPLLLAGDHGGYRLKEEIKKYLSSLGVAFEDLGTDSKESCDYPDFAASLARLISSGAYDQGILLCKSGIGNSIVANRFPGVRAALCYNFQAAKLSRQHNNSNVLLLGANFTKKSEVKRMIKVWLNTPFDGGRHTRRLKKLQKIERELIINKKSDV